MTVKASPRESIAVIIPYYQRAPGLLRRAIASVAVQRVDANLQLFVVDDASPRSALDELDGFEPLASVTRVIPRENGGPAAARNTGLEHVGSATFVAFLDSDDVWREDHLDAALSGLRQGADLYFCDVDEGHGMTWFDRQGFARDRVGLDRATSLAIVPAGEARRMVLIDHLTHASGVVYRWSAAPGLRFEETLRRAGEDHLFWIRLCSLSREVAIDFTIGVVRGEGIGMFTNAMQWDNPQFVDVLSSVYRKYLYMAADPSLSPDEQALVRRRIVRCKEQLAYITLTNVLARRIGVRQSLQVVRKAGVGVGWFAPGIVGALMRKFSGRFDVVY